MKKLMVLPIVILSVLLIVSAVACGSGTEYSLHIDVNEGQGEIYPSSGIYYYPAGTLVTVVAIPDDGWEFSYFNQADLERDCGIEHSYSNPILVTLDGDTYIGVVFTEATSSSTPTPTPISTCMPTDAVMNTPIGCVEWFCGTTLLGQCCDLNGNGQYEIAECSNEIAWHILTGQISYLAACPSPTPTPTP